VIVCQAVRYLVNRLTVNHGLNKNKKMKRYSVNQLTNSIKNNKKPYYYLNKRVFEPFGWLTFG
jgi:hypothetical protein